MHTTIRSASARVNVIVGPLVALLGVAAALTAIILSLALGTGWFMILLLAALMGIGAGLFILRMARRARLEIDANGFTWCGMVGPAHSLRWDQLHQLLPPPSGRSRTVAVARLRDGRSVEVQALWESPTSPAALLGGTDHSAAQNALLAAHRRWLTAPDGSV